MCVLNQMGELYVCPDSNGQHILILINWLSYSARRRFIKVRLFESGDDYISGSMFAGKWSDSMLRLFRHEQFTAAYCSELFASIWITFRVLSLDAVVIAESLAASPTFPSQRSLTLPSLCLRWIMMPNYHRAAFPGFNITWSHGKPEEYNGSIIQRPRSRMLTLLGFTNRCVVS